MTRYLAPFAMCSLAIAIAPRTLQGQEPAAVIPAPSASSETSAIRITDKPVAFTPLEAAQKLYLTGEFDRAIEQYRSMIAGGTDEAVAYAGIARAYLKLKRPDDALAAASKAVELDPSLAGAHSALGEVYYRQGRLYDAQTQFLFPFRIGTGDARSYLGLERLYLASFNFKRAKVAIDKAHELDPKDPDISADWLNTRPLAERIKATEEMVSSPSGFYNRSAIARARRSLVLMKDTLAHPERTCSLATRPGSSEMPLVPAGNSDRPSELMALDAEINGTKSKMVIGMGEAKITINGKIARKAHLEQIVRTDEEGLGDENPPESYAGFARSIKIGALTFRNCYVTVDDHVTPKSYFDYFDGSVGAAVFHDYLVDLDMPHARLRLRPLPERPAADDKDAGEMNSTDPEAAKFHDRYIAPEMNDWVQLYRFGNTVAIPVQLNESPPELFSMSTAASRNVISPHFAEKWAALAGAAPPMFGVNGRIPDQLTGTVRLLFAGLSFASTGENVADLASENERDGVEFEGALGFEVLHNLRMTVDYRDGLIHFDNGRTSQAQ